MYTAESLWANVPRNWPPKVDGAISEFESRDWLSLHHLEDDGVLYHYTDLSGLQGILHSKKLWSTHVSSLNDAQEIKYGIALIEEIIEDISEDPEREETKEWLRSIIMYVQAVQRRITHHVFVSCFCEDPDLLSQWRGYGTQAGYALGFSFSDSTRIYANWNEKWFKPTLRRVIYDGSKQRRLVEDYLNRLLFLRDEIDFRSLSISEFDSRRIWSSVALGAANPLIEMALSFKNAGFAEEKEWRLIRVLPDHHVAKEDFQLRSCGDYMIPYLETSFGTEDDNEIRSGIPIREVYTGPTLEKEVAEIGVDYLLRDNGFEQDSVKVKSSEIPFRKL